MATFNLEPRFDNHKSFYGKARIETWGGWGQNVNLYSYDTLVSQIGYMDVDGTGEEFVLLLHPYWACSVTTLRHVKEFMQQYGFGYMSKREIIAAAKPYDDYLIIVRP